MKHVRVKVLPERLDEFTKALPVTLLKTALSFADGYHEGVQNGGMVTIPELGNGTYDSDFFEVLDIFGCADKQVP